MSSESEGHDRVAALRVAIESAGNPHHMYDDSERHRSPVLGGLFKKLFTEKYMHMVQDARQRQQPLVMVHMSDGWACDTTAYRSNALAKGTGHTCGRQRSEYLAEKVIWKTLTNSGDVQSTLYIAPPQALTDKSGWTIFCSSLAVPYPRLLMGSGTLCLSFYLQDGLHWQSMLRRHQARTTL